MSNSLRSYRFATAAQWPSGLFRLANRQLGGQPGSKGLEPLRPYGRTAEWFASQGASAPALLLTREMLWRDDARQLHRLSAAGEIDTFPAPEGVATSPRLVANVHGLWAVANGNLLCHEPESMTHLAAVNFPGARLVDLAFLSCDTLGILAETGGGWSLRSVGRDGNTLATAALAGLHHAVACAFLRHSRLLVVLSDGPHPRLSWFSIDGGAPNFSLPVSLLFPCCQCHALASGDDDRIYIAASSSGRHVILVLDADGTLVDTVPVDAADTPVAGLAASRGKLYAAGPRGLLRYSAAETVPTDATETSCSFLTPVLDSPNPEGASPWLRADILASLPEGCGVEFTVASTSDHEVRDRLAATAADTRLSPSLRIRKILNEPDIWQAGTSFHGAASTTLSAPLFEFSGRFLWIYVTLTAPPGSAFPALSELKVLYPGHGLMENLPAIYRQNSLGPARHETRPDGFLRQLVGVLEATTQGLDASIASLGSHIHPDTAPEPWLNYIARWLGLPWDDALALEQKRALIRQAPELARKRGTRAGLEILLQCLFADTPRRFRIVDATADFGFAILGCTTGPGSALPALLGGYSRGRAELGPRSILGVMRLPCPNQPDDPTSRWRGRVRVDIAATNAERNAWEPWIQDVLSAMAPAGVRLVLRWTPPYSLKPNALGENLVLESAPLPHLGADAVTGLARLPVSKPRLSQTGLFIGARLR